MSRPEFKPLSMPSPMGNGAGAPLLVEQFKNKWVQVTGTFDATLTLEGTMDGSTWVPISSGAVTAAGLVEVAPTFKFIRGVVSLYVDGAPAATFGGFDDRTV